MTLGVVAKTSGGMPKMCQVTRHHIKPLSLHHRIHAAGGEGEDLPWNVLELRGDFSISMLHDWMSAALPEVPPRMEDDSFELAFASAYTGSQLRIACHEVRPAAQAELRGRSGCAIPSVKASSEERSSAVAGAARPGRARLGGVGRGRTCRGGPRYARTRYRQWSSSGISSRPRRMTFGLS